MTNLESHNLVIIITQTFTPLQSKVSPAFLSVFGRRIKYRTLTCAKDKRRKPFLQKFLLKSHPKEQKLDDVGTVAASRTIHHLLA